MLLAPFLWIFCEFDEKVLDNLSLDASVQTFLLFYVSRSLDSCQAVHTQHNAGDAGCLLRGIKNCLLIFGS